MTENKYKKAGFVAVLGALGLFLGRLHGGGFIHGVPKLLKAVLWALPFAVASGAAVWPYVGPWTAFAISVAVLAFTGIMKNTGHGRGMSIGEDMEPGSKPEKLEYLILWLQPYMPNYWYKTSIMAVIGLFRQISPAVAIGWHFPPAGAIVALGGLVGLPLAYLIGWKIYPDGKGDGPEVFHEATAIGEGLGGLFAFVCLGFAFALIFDYVGLFGWFPVKP